MREISLLDLDVIESSIVHSGIGTHGGGVCGLGCKGGSICGWWCEL